MPSPHGLVHRRIKVLIVEEEVPHISYEAFIAVISGQWCVSF